MSKTNLEIKDRFSDTDNIKEKAKQLIDQLPQNKVEQILIFLTGIKFDDDLEDDLFCNSLLKDYLNDNDPHKHDSMTLEDFAKQEGVILWVIISLSKKEPWNLYPNYRKMKKPMF